MQDLHLSIAAPAAAAADPSEAAEDAGDEAAAPAADAAAGLTLEELTTSAAKVEVRKLPVVLDIAFQECLQEGLPDRIALTRLIQTGILNFIQLAGKL